MITKLTIIYRSLKNFFKVTSVQHHILELKKPVFQVYVK